MNGYESTPAGGQLSGRTGKYPPVWRLSGRLGVALLGVFVLARLAVGGELPDPDKVMAAYIRNFAHYVTWPTNAFAGVDSSWRIGVLGDDSFAEVVEKVLAGRTEQGRAFTVVHANKIGELSQCQIVFIAYKDPAKRREALGSMKHLPVLTVGNAPEFLQEGGIIRFKVRERVEMSINLDQANAATLTIPTKMLEVSAQVVENGKTRTLR